MTGFMLGTEMLRGLPMLLCSTEAHPRDRPSAEEDMAPVIRE